MRAQKSPRRTTRNTKLHNSRLTTGKYYYPSVRRRIVGSLSIVLIFCLLSSSTVAAPQTLVGAANEWKASLVFWSRTSGVPAKVYRALTGQNAPQPRKQEEQQERNARVSSIKIHPGDVTLHVDENILLAAVAYDQSGGPVGGVQFTWDARDDDHNDSAVISPYGEFHAEVPGHFTITAQGAAKRTTVTITVLDVAHRRDKNETP